MIIIDTLIICFDTRHCKARMHTRIELGFIWSNLGWTESLSWRLCVWLHSLSVEKRKGLNRIVFEEKRITFRLPIQVPLYWTKAQKNRVAFHVLLCYCIYWIRVFLSAGNLHLCFKQSTHNEWSIFEAASQGQKDLSHRWSSEKQAKLLTTVPIWIMSPQHVHCQRMESKEKKQ